MNEEKRITIIVSVAVLLAFLIGVGVGAYSIWMRCNTEVNENNAKYPLCYYQSDLNQEDCVKCNSELYNRNIITDTQMVWLNKAKCGCK